MAITASADHNGYYDRDGRYHRIRYRDRDYGPPPAQGYGAAAASAAGPIISKVPMRRIATAATPPNGDDLRRDRGRADWRARQSRQSRRHGRWCRGGRLLGNVIGRDMDCDDQPVAYRVYADSLNGDIGRPYEWHNRGNHGTFTSVREFRRGDQSVPRLHRNDLARRTKLHRTTAVLPRNRHGQLAF